MKKMEKTEKMEKFPLYLDFRVWLAGLLLVITMLTLRIVVGPSAASPPPSVTDTVPMFEGTGIGAVEDNQGIVNVGGLGRAAIAHNHGTVNIGVSGATTGTGPRQTHATGVHIMIFTPNGDSPMYLAER